MNKSKILIKILKEWNNKITKEAKNHRANKETWQKEINITVNELGKFIKNSGKEFNDLLKMQEINHKLVDFTKKREHELGYLKGLEYATSLLAELLTKSELEDD